MFISVFLFNCSFLHKISFSFTFTFVGDLIHLTNCKSESTGEKTKSIISSEHFGRAKCYSKSLVIVKFESGSGYNT